MTLRDLYPQSLNNTFPILDSRQIICSKYGRVKNKVVSVEIKNVKAETFYPRVRHFIGKTRGFARRGAVQTERGSVDFMAQRVHHYGRKDTVSVYRGIFVRGDLQIKIQR